ncbi:MAG: metallophosphoesterase [Solirubrobacteraceae bacterium]
MKCRPGYVRRSIRVPVRRHGRIVRRHGKIVYTRVQRCVRVSKRKTPSPSFPPLVPPTTSPVATISPPSTAPANTAVPTISGSATQGSSLSASTGTWTNSPTSYGYQWQRCNAGGGACQNLTGATTSTYLPGSAEVGSTLRVAVTAGNASGSASATSAATGAIGLPTDPVVVAAGDIACPAAGGPSCQQAATETIATNENPSAVFVLGDNQYDNGLFSEYNDPGAYNATWGLFNPIVDPVPGNHEYGKSSSAAGYFEYFGALAHPPDGYYSFNLGTWHLVALNSNCSNSGCSDPLPGATTAAQTSWLQSDLAAHPSACVLGFWHHPLFSSGWTLGSPGVAPLWAALYQAHADIVLGGHDHLYEDYAQQDPSGRADPNGIREFVVGTGGESLNGLGTAQPNLQAHDSQFGVLVLTLHPSSYDYKFVTTGGAEIDKHTGVPCHGPGSSAAASVAGARSASRAQATALSGPPLVFEAHPFATSLTAIEQRGLAVAIHANRGVDVVVTASLRRGRRLHRIASFYETESEIPKPYSQIRLRLPVRSLQRVRAVALVLRFAAVDAAEHHRVVTRIVSLR